MHSTHPWTILRRALARTLSTAVLGLVASSCIAPLPDSGCDSSKDCAPGWLCIGSLCREICAHDDDCTAGACTAEGYCDREGPGDCECLDPGPCDSLEGVSCVAGQCVYPPKACDQPPEPECAANDDVYRTHSQVGTCEPNTGDCVYASREVGCPDCSATCLGRCQGYDCSDPQGGCRLAGFCIPEDPPRCEIETAEDGRACALPDGGAGHCEAGTCQPPRCSTEQECDDQDSCTRDACDGGVCTNVPMGECTQSGEQWQTISCGDCGAQQQQRVCTSDCRWDIWTDVGACTGQGTCSPSTPPRSRAVVCGNCGTQQQENACAEDCSWTGWTNVGVCADQGVCQANVGTQTRTRSCNSCSGRKNQRRDCSAACSWGSWYDTSSCTNPPADNGDPCSEPSETWRCAYIPYWKTNGSQVCRGGSWVTYHLNPQSCSGCCGDFSAACE